MEKRSDNERLQHISNNIRIRYKNCIFTYKPSHNLKMDFKDATGGKEKRPNRFVKITKGMRRKVGRIADTACEVIDGKKHFANCRFLSPNDETKIKNFVRGNSLNVTNIFEECKFIQRGSTIFEKIMFRFRKIGGIIFEFDYRLKTANIKNYTFRLKDISVVSSYVQQTLEEN